MEIQILLAMIAMPSIDDVCAFNSNHACPPKSFVAMYHLPKKNRILHSQRSITGGIRPILDAKGRVHI